MLKEHNALDFTKTLQRDPERLLFLLSLKTITFHEQQFRSAVKCSIRILFVAMLS